MGLTPVLLLVGLPINLLVSRLPKHGGAIATIRAGYDR